jgi:hypothetical protein
MTEIAASPFRLLAMTEIAASPFRLLAMTEIATSLCFSAMTILYRVSLQGIYYGPDLVI